MRWSIGNYQKSETTTWFKSHLCWIFARHVVEFSFLSHSKNTKVSWRSPWGFWSKFFWALPPLPRIKSWVHAWGQFLKHWLASGTLCNYCTCEWKLAKGPGALADFDLWALTTPPFTSQFQLASAHKSFKKLAPGMNPHSFRMQITSQRLSATCLDTQRCCDCYLLCPACSTSSVAVWQRRHLCVKGATGMFTSAGQWTSSRPKERLKYSGSPFSSNP